MAGEKKAGIQTVVGVTGLSVWAGVLREEYLTALTGTRKAKVFRQMQDDPVIACLLDAVTMPLLAAEFQTQPAGDSPRDKENAEFLWQVMNDMTDYSWRQHVVDMLTMMVWGWAASEVVFKKREGLDAQRPSAYNDGKMGFHILDPRGQETLDRWIMKKDEFVVEGLRQQDPNTAQYLDIPAWKLVHVTFRSKKRSPEGTSPMRSLYQPWYTRKNLEVIEAIGAERDLCGLPVMTLPYGATDADKTVAEKIIRNIRQDEEAGVLLPPPPTPEAQSGWKLELLSSAGSKQFNVRAIIQDYNKVILMRFFAQFLMLGMEKVGTQALVEGSQDFFSLCLKSVQQELLEAWNQHLVRLLFSMNPQLMAGATGLPTIDWADPGSKDVKGVVETARGMVAANLLTPEETLEDYLRGIAGLPDRPEGIGVGPRGGQAAPALPEEAPQGPQLFDYEWHRLPGGGWLAHPFAGTSEGAVKKMAQPDPADVHVPTSGKKRRDHCMNCSAAPTVEVLWAEGAARAWFCDECYKAWKDESGAHEVVEERKVESGTVPDRWSEQSQDVAEMASYVEVAGIKGRPATTRAGKATNEYQGLLTHLYDRWASKTKAAILAAQEAGEKDLTGVLDKEMLRLGMSLRLAGKKHIAEAVRLGLRGRPVSKAAQALIDKQVEQNNKYLVDSLLPRIRDKIVVYLKEVHEHHQYQVDELGLLGLLESMRSEPSAYAGAFWSAIFLGAALTQKEEDTQREDSGKRPRRVRWVLDPAAEHCKESEHGYGCPDLAGEYDSWDEMRTVPAGRVTCLGGCRCSLEVQNDAGQWERVA